MKIIIKILVLLCFISTVRAEILQEITTSSILEPNHYTVPNPPLLIHGDIDVVIPSGVTFELGEVWDYGIVVYDGANVYFGEPNSITGDPNVPVQPNLVNLPVQIVGESGLPFFNNYCGIFIDRTAGTKSRLHNIYMSGFWYAMFVDQQLELEISNIYSFGNYSGIVSFGSNRFSNCYVSYFGIWMPEFQYWGYAYIGNVQTLAGALLNGSEFLYRNCLANNGDDAFTVYGSMDMNSVPDFEAWDCPVTNCYSGFNGWNGNVGFKIIKPGFHNVFQTTNFHELPLTDPVFDPNTDPLVIDPNDYRITLNPDSNFVDNSSGLSSLHGSTTRQDGLVDDGVGDLWLHYPTEHLDALTADFDSDRIVNANDLYLLACDWLNSDPDSLDLNSDGITNFIEFAALANQWQSIEMYIEMFNAETLQAVDSKNIFGYVGMQLKDIPLDAGIISVYVDDVQVGGWMLGWSHEERLIGFESDMFSNGWHTIRLVSTSLILGVTNHEPINVYFNNLLHRVSAGNQFHPDEDYTYRGFYDGGNTLDVQLTNQEGQVIWSNTYSGNHINITIPGAIFESAQFCELSITEIEGVAMLTTGESGPVTAAGSSSFIKKDLTKKFKKTDWLNGAMMVIVLPNKDVYKVRKPAIIECAKACDARGVIWVALHEHDVTEENLRYLFSKPICKYIYWCGHANSHVGAAVGVEGVQRTHTVCWEVDEGLIWDSWKERGVFSWTNDGDFPLPNDWDVRGFSLWDLNMYQSWNKKIIFVDGCLSASYHDMAGAYGVFSDQGWGSRDQIYIGWRTKVLVSTGVMENIVGNTTEGVRIFWEEMGEGKSIWDSFYETQTSGGVGMRKALWGDNGLINIGDRDGDDNIFLYGNGIVTNIKLNP